jgi:PIN domain nuclease of toxin-antitoxin system
MTDRRVVLDSSAVIAWLRREVGWQVVDQALSQGIIPSPCMSEVLYSAVAAGFDAPLDELYESLLLTGLVIEPVLDRDCVRSAQLVAQSRGRSRGQGRPSLSLADAQCMAVAERLGCALVGSDRHWAVYQLSVPFLPFR